jgi:hypothetical protein
VVNESEDEASWLFRKDPIARDPSASDRDLVQALEARVAGFDAAVRTGELGDPRESARRRIILAELGAAGLLEEPLLERRIEVLAELGLGHLRSIASAARALATYYASDARARYVRHPAPASIHDAALSLDFARTAAPPEGLDTHAWWAFCENAFLDSPASDDARGQIFVLQGPIGAELSWRWEDGSRRTLYAAVARMRTR